MKLWNENENKYQEQLRKEYNLDNLFQHQRKENTVAKSISVFDTAMVEYRKETLFFKVKNFIKRIFK